jgi:rhamnosyltransferase
MKPLITPSTHASIDDHWPSVIVLLATHNGVRYIDEQLQSVIAQQGVRIRVYVSDDQSTDGTWERLQQLARENTSITLFERGIFGSAASNFLRLLHDSPISDYEFVAFCDQDDVWLPTKLQRAIFCMNTDGCGGYSSDLTAFHDGSEQTWHVRKFGIARRIDYIFGGASAGCTYVLSSKAALTIRTCVLVAPKHDWSHDWLFYAVCRSRGIRWYFDRGSLVRYRQHARNVYGARTGLAGILAKTQAIRSGWYRRQILQNGRYLLRTVEEEAAISRVERLQWRDRFWIALRGSSLRRRIWDGLALSVLSLVMGRETINSDL